MGAEVPTPDASRDAKETMYLHVIETPPLCSARLPGKDGRVPCGTLVE